MTSMTCTCPHCGGTVTLAIEAKTEVVAKFHAPPRKSLAEDIAMKHALANGITFKQIMSAKNRSHKFSHPRQDAMREMREIAGMTYPAIQHFFGFECHKTVFHGIKASRERAAEAEKRRVEALGPAVSTWVAERH